MPRGCLFATYKPDSDHRAPLTCLPLQERQLAEERLRQAASRHAPGPCLAALVQACHSSCAEADPHLHLRLAMQALVLVLSRTATEQLLPQLPAVLPVVRGSGTSAAVCLPAFTC